MTASITDTDIVRKLQGRFFGYPSTVVEEIALAVLCEYRQGVFKTGVDDEAQLANNAEMVRHIDDNVRYYMQSRGVDDKTALGALRYVATRYCGEKI